MLQVCMDRVPRSKVRSRVRLPPSKGVGAERKARAESQSGKPERWVIWGGLVGRVGVVVGAKGLSGGIEQWSAQVGKPERKAKALGHFGRVSRAG